MSGARGDEAEGRRKREGEGGMGWDWIGLDWIGLGWIGLDWVGLDGWMDGRTDEE